jgi:DGQHR domain-containing protein
MGRKKRSPSHIEFPCLTFAQGKHEMALFPCLGKQLWEIVVVNQFDEEDKVEGYQRVLSQARAEAIADFIDDGNLIPNSVLISFDEAEIIKHGKAHSLRVPNKENAGWVIDGQHRLAGAFGSERDVLLPVVAAIGLTLEEQVQCFVTINKEHKGVPSSLYYELMKRLPGTRTDTQRAQERATDLAGLLRVDEESPFLGKIVTSSSPKKGELSLTNFVRKVAPLVKPPTGRLSVFKDEDRCAALNNYYRAIEQVFPREYEKEGSIFFRTLGFGAMMNVLPMVLDLSMNQTGKCRVQDIVGVLRKVDFFDVSAWHQIGTGNDAENNAASDLQTALSNVFQTKKSASVFK